MRWGKSLSVDYKSDLDTGLASLSPLTHQELDLSKYWGVLKLMQGFLEFLTDSLGLSVAPWLHE